MSMQKEATASGAAAPPRAGRFPCDDRRIRGVVLIAACLVLLSFPNRLSAQTGEEVLQCDPLLLKQIATTWELIAQADNPLWPGWNARQTPILIYLPGRQEVLLNHPSPPETFEQYTGRFAGDFRTVHYLDGPTSIRWDGQNTSREMYGEETLVLADTLSNRKNWLRGWAADPRESGKKLEDLGYASLRADPYEQIAMIAHEAFHVFQMRNLHHKAADERHIRQYPCLSVPNNLGFALEAEMLLESLQADDEAATRDAALRWLAIRGDRRQALPEVAVEYEDRNEFIEGVAKYIEVVCMENLEGTAPDPVLWNAQGFRGFQEMDWFRERRLRSMRENLRGEVNVNNDPYGSSPVRGRLYFSGMGQALLLDKIAADWKQQIARPEATLTQLVYDAIQPGEGELETALAQVRQHPDYEELLAAKEKLAEDGRRDTEKMLAGITGGPNTLLVIDWSALQTDRIGLSFTAFGVRRVDVDRTIYTLVPIAAQMGSADYSFEQNNPLPTLEDRKKKQFRFQLQETVPVGKLVSSLGEGEQGVWNAKDLHLNLPGAIVKAARARVTHREGEIFMKFLPAETGEQDGQKQQ